MQRTLKSILTLAALAASLALTGHAAPAIVGNSGLSGQSLDADTAKAVLLGKAVKIGSDRVVIIVAKESAAQDDFLKATVGMNSGQFQNHWRRLFMTGGGTAPKVVATEAEAVELAAQTPGGICIVDSATAGSLPILSSS